MQHTFFYFFLFFSFLFFSFLFFFGRRSFMAFLDRCRWPNSVHRYLFLGPTNLWVVLFLEYFLYLTARISGQPSMPVVMVSIYGSIA